MTLTDAFNTFIQVILFFGNFLHNSCETGQNTNEAIEKTGQNIYKAVEKTGRIMYCIVGGGDLCIEKIPLL